MATEVIYADEVYDDLERAYSWYERRRRGLGEELLTHIHACIERLCRQPESCERVKGNIRRALVRRFPYAIIYEAIGDSLHVYVVCHTAQDSDKWLDRLPQ